MAYNEKQVIKNDYTAASPVPAPMFPGNDDPNSNWVTWPVPGSASEPGTSHYNEFRTKIVELLNDSYPASTTLPNAKYGYGYPVDAAFVPVYDPDDDPIDYVGYVPGNIISATQWNKILSYIEKMRVHQGTSFASLGGPGLPTSVTTGAVVIAQDNAPLGTTTSLLDAINLLKTNALNISPTELSVSATKVAALNPNLTPGTSSVIFSVTFASGWDSARHFFNTGGKINISSDVSGAGFDTTWQAYFLALGTLSVNATGITSSVSGAVAGSLGFYNLTTTNQVIYPVTTLANGDTFSIIARLLTAPGTTPTITFSVNYVNSSASDRLGNYNTIVNETRSINEIPYNDTINYSFTGINEPMLLSATPTQINASGIAGVITTNATTIAITSGGSSPGPGGYTYTWATLSGTVPDAINGGTTNTITISNNVSTGVSEGGILRCTVTDIANGRTAFIDVSWSTSAYGTLNVTLTPTTQSALIGGPGMAISPPNGNYIITTSGGSGNFRTDWSADSPIQFLGGVPSAIPPTFTTRAFVNLGSGQTVSGIIRCTVTDLATSEVRVVQSAATFTSSIAALVANTPVIGGSTTCTVSSGNCSNNASATANVTGGFGTYTYQWYTIGNTTGVTLSNMTSAVMGISTTTSPTTTYTFDTYYVVTDVASGEARTSAIVTVMLRHKLPNNIIVDITANQGSATCGTSSSCTNYFDLTANVSGTGVGPFTYAWSLLSSTGSWSATSATTPATTVSSSNAPGTYTATYQCILTDTSDSSTGVDTIYLTSNHVQNCSAYSQTFYSSGTYVVSPTNGSTVYISGCGGGGGGGGGCIWRGAPSRAINSIQETGGSGGGGAGAGWVSSYPISVGAGDQIQITIGNGGSPGAWLNGTPPVLYSYSSSSTGPYYNVMGANSGGYGGDTVISIMRVGQPSFSEVLRLQGGQPGAGFYFAFVSSNPYGMVSPAYESIQHPTLPEEDEFLKKYS